MVEILSIRDPWVQEFLWKYLIAEDIRHDYTKYDAIKYVYEQVSLGECLLVGDKETEVVFRCVSRNPKVIEPHVMGKGINLRKTFRECLPIAWERGFERVIVWTQYHSLVRIMTKLGMTLDGVVPRCHFQDSKLLDLYVLSLERPKE